MLKKIENVDEMIIYMTLNVVLMLDLRYVTFTAYVLPFASLLMTVLDKVFCAIPLELVFAL